MRLVELHRAALGVPSPPRPSWESRFSDDGPVVEVGPEQPAASAVLAIEATATPANDVIPGAIVTVTLSLSSEGAEPARNVRVSVPLPAAATFRNGSFVRDGRPQLDDAADELFGEGLSIAEIPPRARVTLLWKIGVRLGNTALAIAPLVRAENTAIVGAKRVVVSRKAEPRMSFSGEVSREVARTAPESEFPFYELDEEEQL
ncbi:MAG: hypothetical protein ACXWMY_17165, partial [Vulcanimicrobiaceae bacterium]